MAYLSGQVQSSPEAMPRQAAGWGLRPSSERSEGAVNPDLFLLAVISRLKPYMVFCISWFDPQIHYPSPMVLEKVRFILMNLNLLT